MKIYCYARCSTCKRALGWLDENGIPYESIDIKMENPNAENLTTWYHRSGLPLKRFFNTSGMQYRSLGLKDRLPAMTEEEQLALLATDGLLVKRPLVVGDDFVLLGFKESEWKERFKGV